MNKLEIKKETLPSRNDIGVFYIDGKPLYKYFEEWLKEKPELFEELAPFNDLEICWTDEYDYEGDARFIRFVLEKDNAITPILSCPDDFDFTCIVIVAEIIKQADKVTWKRIGRVNHSGENIEDEKRSGILCIEAYTDEDWKLYGDNIALEKVDSQAWGDWIGENWSEEIYRRRVNYTFPYYQNPDNIEWFADRELNMIRHYANSHIERYRQYAHEMSVITDYAKNKEQYYVDGVLTEKRLEAEETFKQLLKAGVNPADLYKTNKLAKHIIECVDAYKKKLFVDKIKVKRAEEMMAKKQKDIHEMSVR